MFAARGLSQREAATMRRLGIAGVLAAALIVLAANPARACGPENALFPEKQVDFRLVQGLGAAVDDGGRGFHEALQDAAERQGVLAQDV